MAMLNTLNQLFTKWDTFVSSDYDYDYNICAKRKWLKMYCKNNNIDYKKFKKASNEGEVKTMEMYGEKEGSVFRYYS